LLWISDGSAQDAACRNVSKSPDIDLSSPRPRIAAIWLADAYKIVSENASKRHSKLL